MPNTPKRGQRGQQQQQRQQRQQQQQASPPVAKKTSLPREWRVDDNGDGSESISSIASFLTFEESEQVKAALLMEAARIKEKLRRTYSANCSMRRRRQQQQQQRQQQQQQQQSQT